MLDKSRLLTTISTVAIGLMFSIISSCEQPEERLWINPYDSDTNQDLWAPTNLIATQQTVRKTKLQWKDNAGGGDSNAAGEEGFKINRQLEDKDWEMDYAQVGPNQTTWVDTMSFPGSIKYGVYAFAGANSSSTATVDITTSFPAPTNFETSQTDFNKVKLSWTDEYADGYFIERKHDNGSWENVISLWLNPGSPKEWTDSSFIHGSQLSYRIYGLVDDIRSSPAEATIEANFVFLDDFDDGDISDWVVTNSNNVLAEGNALIINGEELLVNEGAKSISEATNSQYNLVGGSIEFSVYVKYEGTEYWEGNPHRIGLYNPTNDVCLYFSATGDDWYRIYMYDYNQQEWITVIGQKPGTDVLDAKTGGIMKMALSNNIVQIFYNDTKLEEVDLSSIILSGNESGEVMDYEPFTEFAWVVLSQQQPTRIRFDNVTLSGVLSSSSELLKHPTKDSFKQISHK